jgi:hypothetical protein
MIMLNKNQSISLNETHKASHSATDNFKSTRGNRNKDDLNSNARISLIDTFFPLEINWDLSASRPKPTFDHLWISPASNERTLCKRHAITRSRQW